MFFVCCCRFVVCACFVISYISFQNTICGVYGYTHPECVCCFYRYVSRLFVYVLVVLCCACFHLA